MSHQGRVGLEAPPGFEPGMADLQSAALAAWLRGLPLRTILISTGASMAPGRESPCEKGDRTLEFQGSCPFFRTGSGRGPSRIRTGDGGFAIHCLTAWLRGRYSAAILASLRLWVNRAGNEKPSRVRG